jgi:hypothetical protein
MFHPDTTAALYSTNGGFLAHPAGLRRSLAAGWPRPRRTSTLGPFCESGARAPPVRKRFPQEHRWYAVDQQARTLNDFDAALVETGTQGSKTGKLTGR